MSRSVIPSGEAPGTRVLPLGLAGAVSDLAKRAVLARLKKVERGTIRLEDGAERLCFGRGLPEAVIRVHDQAFYTDIAFGGSIGSAEAYMAGYWTCSDLAGLVRIAVLNRSLLQGIDLGTALLTRPLHWALQQLRRNTKDGSRRNIEAHYDLGNDFYRLWLDASMTYSSNIFEKPDSTLEAAAAAKYDRLCRKLRLGPGDHVLEIGTGWGGFALHAVRNYGCRVTTTTISRQQHDWARELFDREKLGDKVALLFEDYRDLKGKFDKLVSIEMIEAVGREYLETYFKACSDRLLPHGLMGLQSILIHDRAYEYRPAGADFIRRYIFPGGFIPSVENISRSVAKATDMRVFHYEDMTPHYARTLRTWRERFFANIGEVRRLGYPETFIRMWDYYLSSCEGAFEERHLGSAQFVLAKPDSRPADLLPALG